jgi:hypothetical protein
MQSLDYCEPRLGLTVLPSMDCPLGVPGSAGKLLLGQAQAETQAPEIVAGGLDGSLGHFYDIMSVRCLAQEPFRNFTDERLNDVVFQGG